MTLPVMDKKALQFWIRVFAGYAVVEAVIQFLFWVILNNFGNRPISLPELHIAMWVFQCVLIIPIWWVAWRCSRYPILVQILANTAFCVVYNFAWFGPVQQLVHASYDVLIQFRPENASFPQPKLDRPQDPSILNYQLLKYAFRLSWFFLANYLYRFQKEEQQRNELALANRELELKLLSWHLNPSFYFNTIRQLQHQAVDSPSSCTTPILQLAKVMEYVIYDTREKLIPVSLELVFLKNYIALLNRQGSNHIQFEFSENERAQELRIAPLLLGGLMDKLVNPTRSDHVLQLQISIQDANLVMRIIKENMERRETVIPPDDAVYLRLNDLYPGKYILHLDKQKNSMELTLQLHGKL